MTDINKLILYKDFENGEILYNLCFIYDNINSENIDKEELVTLLYDSINALLDLSYNHGLKGNLWHSYLAYLLANNENAYSCSCEIVGNIEGSINDIVANDYKIFLGLYKLDWHKVEKILGTNCISLCLNYISEDRGTKVYNKLVRDNICRLGIELGQADDVNVFKDIITEFYKDFGVGRFGLHKAFRIEHSEDGGIIVPINNTAQVNLDDLVGYEIQKKKLIDNTESFVRGKKANNCLLFGDAGTGKSTSIKAILNKYYSQGLRVIEVYKHQLQDLASVIAQIKNRNYKFIIFMDDLSFEEFEIEYKYLKAIIEGGLEKKPDNVLIYATSNRRHLVRERSSDKFENEDDLHKSDTVQEKLSLVARFGVTIYFASPDKKEFQQIVKSLAEKNNICMPEDELLLEANKWELSHGGLSGRTAQQFIDYLDSI